MRIHIQKKKEILTPNKIEKSVYYVIFKLIAFFFKY